MIIYSPNYFKPDFTENKNRFKEPEISDVKIKAQAPAFKVKYQGPVAAEKEKVYVSRPARKSFIKLVNNRMGALKLYFFNLADSYFKEEVV